MDGDYLGFSSLTLSACPVDDAWRKSPRLAHAAFVLIHRMLQPVDEAAQVVSGE